MSSRSRSLRTPIGRTRSPLLIWIIAELLCWAWLLTFFSLNTSSFFEWLSMVWSLERYPDVTFVPIALVMVFLFRLGIYYVLPISVLFIRKFKSSSPGIFLTSWLAFTRLTTVWLFLPWIWLSWPILTWDASLPVSCFLLFSSYFFCFIACLSNGANI